jgi:hypothetical protein
MKNMIIKDMEKRDRIRNELTLRFKSEHATRGKGMSFSMPALKEPFPNLRKVIFESTHKNDYHNVYYYFETKHGYIKDLVPASEYYKIVFYAIAEKLYSIEISCESINAILQRIIQSHLTTRVVHQATEQPSFNICTGVYSMKTEIGNLFFNIRSVMDTVSTLLHFLYGKGAKQFSSFADFTKYICKETDKEGELTDPIMKDYISQMDWFFILRDIRDYITHFGTIEIDFYENTPSQLTVYG